MTDSLKIPNKILGKMKRNIKLKPVINLSVSDAIDVHSITKHSPNVEAEREYRVCLGNLPMDHGVNKFAVKMRDYDVSIGTNQVAVKEIPLSRMKKWKDYKAIQPHLLDYKPYEECQILELNKFIDFCESVNITEKQLWGYLLDDTYSKSKEIIYTFYPTIIPIPRQHLSFQKLNSHCLLLTQSKSGKTYTCFKLYPNENYEDMTVASLIGTVTKFGERKGLLDGQGICFIDEINKLKRMKVGDTEDNKLLDFMNNYLELGQEQRGVWGKSINVKGVKTIIFSGNTNIMQPGEKDFYHIMNCISKFSSDSDKYGRRFAFFVYDSKLNDVEDNNDPDKKILDILNAFRKEIICDRKLQKKIMKIYNKSLDWVNENDEEHKKIIKEKIEKLNSSAIKAFVTGIAKTSHKKLKFMSIKITLTNHIFALIKKDIKNFFGEFEQEISETYQDLKETLCYKQIDNLIGLGSGTDNKRDKFKEYISKNKININERISDEEKERLSKELKIPTSYISVLISECKVKKEEVSSQTSD